MAKQSVTVTVNGTRYQRDIEPRLLLMHSGNLAMSAAMHLKLFALRRTSPSCRN